MSAWAVKDETDSWDTVCDRAWVGKLQFFLRGPSQMAIAISYADYRLVAPKRRKIVKNPKLAFKIRDEDLFSCADNLMISIGWNDSTPSGSVG